MANSALELAEIAGRDVDRTSLERSRDYQKDNFNAEDGTYKADKAAGVGLYAISSGTRATAKDAREAEEAIVKAIEKGDLNDQEEVTLDNLVKAGVDELKAQQLIVGYEQNQASVAMLQDDAVLRGFGNNGGEEFLSFMMTSESLVVTGGEPWENWYEKMDGLLGKIQNGDGSWSGHHCITSPAFCTAAVVLTMTADRDLHVLIEENN
jgi:hypothetical protein